MFKNTLRLIEPAIKNKKSTLFLIFENILSTTWYSVLPMLTGAKLITYISQNKFEEALKFSYIVIFIYIFLLIIHYFLVKYSMYSYYDYYIYIDSKYRINSLKKNNLEYEKMGTGLLQSIINKGISNWADLSKEILSQIPRILLSLTAGMYILYNFQDKSIIVFLILCIVGITLFYYFNNRKQIINDKINDIDDLYNKNTIRTIMSKFEILAADKLENEIKILKDVNLKARFESKKTSEYGFLSYLSIELIPIIITYIGFIIAYTWGYINTITSISFVAIIFFAERFSMNLYQITYIFTLISNDYPKVLKFWKFLDETKDIENYENTNLFEFKNGNISIKNLIFNYGDKETNTINNISLNINSGEKIAIVGMSGSGKTTLVKLISGYITAPKNSIFIDDQDISEISLKSFYKNIGYMTQDAMVFDGTVKENLLYSNPEADEYQLHQVLIDSRCDFILNNEKGINLEIGEKGVRLSGGEKQRLAIAKLLLKNPKIIILDEPTSALDSFSEEAVSVAFDKLFEKRTTIVIAHRLQTVKNADKIIVMENGIIKEEGTHDILLKDKNSLYYKMVELQSGF